MRNRSCFYYLTIIWVFISSTRIIEATIYEAENGILTGSVTILNAKTGFSGAGYTGQFVNDGDRVTINFTLTESASYDLYIGYASPSGDKINNININGNSSEFYFTGSPDFSEILFGKIRLRAGGNSISIIKNWGWLLFDYIRIEPNNDPDIVVTIPYQLSTPDPMTGTLRLFYYLMHNFGKNIQSGVMSLDAIEEAEWLHTNTGKYPALIGLDLMNHTRNWDWFDKSVLVDESIDWYRHNGIVAICWHWRDPLQTTDEFYTDNTDFDISKISEVTSAEYLAMINDIDLVAGYLKQLQDSAVPVIFRPLHEASGGWFWWGSHGPEPCKSLWRLMYDRLVNHHNIKNMIWVWTTDAQSDNLDWYPGDEYVDIISMDIYADNGDFGSQLLAYDKIKDDFQGKKLIALSENGIVPDPDNLVTDEAEWSWFMTWYGSFVRDGITNPPSHWQKVMDHPYVITLDEMPDLTTYPITGMKKNQLSLNFKVCINASGNKICIYPENYTEEYDLFLFDSCGKIILNLTGIKGVYSESISNLTTGIYLVKIVTPAGQSIYKVAG